MRAKTSKTRVHEGRNIRLGVSPGSDESKESESTRFPCLTIIQRSPSQISSVPNSSGEADLSEASPDTM